MRKIHIGWKIGGAALLAAACVVGIHAATTAQAEESTSQLIAENIYIGDISVGGMTQTEASEAVEDYVQSLADTQFTLSVDGRSVVATAEDLGVTWENTGLAEEALNVGKTGNLIERYKSKKDLEHENLVFDISYTADEDQVKSFLSDHASEVNQDAVNYGLTRENGSFTITEGQNGVAVDVDQSAADIVSYIENTWDESDVSLDLVATVVEPEGTEAQLQRVKDVLGTYTTDFSSSSAGRAQNVRNGANKINGALLYPGEQFSVYEAVNPFTAENGYELAGSYENGTTVQTYGGGICQVSTTLYNAVIRAELSIDERFCHSMIVSYVQPSMDAAIAGTYKDLKFTNNYDFPVYIEGYTNGGQITFTVYGEETRSSDREVIFESETTSTTEPQTQFAASSEYSIGYIQTTQNSHTGYTAKLWKIVKENGVEVSRDTFNNSTYSASPKIITVGVKSSNADAVAAVKAAIATGNESTIRAAVAANTSEALKKQEEEEKKTEETEEKKDDEKKDTEKKKDSEKKEDSSSDDEKKTSESSDKKKTNSKESKTEKESGKTTE